MVPVYKPGTAEVASTEENQTNNESEIAIDAIKNIYDQDIVETNEMSNSDYLSEENLLLFNERVTDYINDGNSHDVEKVLEWGRLLFLSSEFNKVVFEFHVKINFRL